jgi:2-(1,2-epoxy-1,2-dihydrophenyl)acetyl-CoA isomerase
MSGSGGPLGASYEHIRLEMAGPVATISIDRPTARNSLTRQTGLELYDAVRRVAEKREVRVCVLRGTGRDFCCGADLKAPSPVGSENVPAAFDTYQVTVLLHEMPAVSVAAIRGGCAGAGFGWACACDLRVGDDTAVMNTAFLDVGVAGDMGVPWTLPRIIGSGRARDLSLLPRKVLAAEALEIGLLNRLWPKERFEEELGSLLTRLTGVAPQALALLKANYVEAERVGLRSFISIEAERHVRLLGSEDRMEAFRAWTEKRPGKFTGR